MWLGCASLGGLSHPDGTVTASGSGLGVREVGVRSRRRKAEIAWRSARSTSAWMRWRKLSCVWRRNWSASTRRSVVAFEAGLQLVELSLHPDHGGLEPSHPRVAVLDVGLSDQRRDFRLCHVEELC